MLTLLSLLQTRRDWPGPLLAERLDISHRTVRRDVDRLRELGYRIHATKGPDGGYRLDAGSELPPLLFDDDQAVALAVALQQIAATAGSGFEEPALRALATVRQVMPSRLRHRVDGLRFTALTTAGPAEAVDPAMLVAVGAAARAQEIVRVDYASSSRDAEPSPARRVEPHHLVSRGARWYLVGFDLDRDDWRVFRVDRMTLRTPNGPRFAAREVPGGDVGAFVSGRFKGSGGADVWPCRGEVVLAAPIAAIAPYAADAVVEDLGDGRCLVSAGAWSWRGLAASLGRFDADLEVVGPPELATAFAELATRFAAAGTATHVTRAG